MAGLMAWGSTRVGFVFIVGLVSAGFLLSWGSSHSGFVSSVGSCLAG